MNPSNTFLVVISAAILFAGPALAIQFEQFDQLSTSAQAELIADIVDRTEQALSDDGKPDLASKTDQLFGVIEPGDKMPVGLAELERNIARARLADAKNVASNPAGNRIDLEDALFVTLKKNGIEVSQKAMDSVFRATAQFHPITGAEFDALPISGRRHSIELLSKIAFPDYALRDMLASNKDSFFGLSDQNIRDLAEIMSGQFPNSGDQPGFENVENAIETDNAKTPNDPVLFILVIYVLDEVQKRVVVRNQDLVNRSVLLPDGRHAYRGDDGDAWIYPGDDLSADAGPPYKLEADLQPLAKRLAECMETGGITDGRRAQIVCLERVAGVHQPPAEPVAAPVAPTAPSPAPTSPSDDDDPIGGGGVITPPDQPHGH